MKKIVPFTKDLMFKTKIGEITSIALDNTLKLNNEVVNGEFVVSGTYKMLEGSTLEEDFKFDLPVDITIDKKYDTTDCKISIDDFYYEIINEEKLRVNISVMLDDLDIVPDPIEEVQVVKIEKLEEEIVDRNEKEFDMIMDELTDDIEVPFKDEIENVKLEIVPDVKIDNNKDKNFHKELLDNLSEEIEYSIYRVYTMKEMDTLDIVLDKYKTTREILMDYNDLDNLRTGSKIIIPSIDE